MLCEDCDQPAEWEAVSPGGSAHACSGHLGVVLKQWTPYIWFVHPVGHQTPRRSGGELMEETERILVETSQIVAQLRQKSSGRQGSDQSADSDVDPPDDDEHHGNDEHQDGDEATGA